MSRFERPVLLLALCVAIGFAVFTGCGQSERPAVQAQAPGVGVKWEHKFFDVPVAGVKGDDVIPGIVVGVDGLNGCPALKEINEGGWEYTGYSAAGAAKAIPLFKRPRR